MKNACKLLFLLPLLIVCPLSAPAHDSPATKEEAQLAAVIDHTMQYDANYHHSYHKLDCHVILRCRRTEQAVADKLQPCSMCKPEAQPAMQQINQRPWS